MKELDDAFYQITVQQRDAAWRENEALRAEVEAHRAFCGEIYKALGTDDADRQKWPSMIRGLHAEKEALLALLMRVRQWDMMDAVADGPHWRREIDTAIGALRERLDK